MVVVMVVVVVVGVGWGVGVVVKLCLFDFARFVSIVWYFKIWLPFSDIQIMTEPVRRIFHWSFLTLREVHDLRILFLST